VDYVLTQYEAQDIGLIGTKRTVQSGVYARKIDEGNKNIRLHSLATPLLAPMIEEGFFNNQISHEIIAQYLDDQKLAGIKALILACTHYPLIKEEIDAYYRGEMKILDSSQIVARALQNYLISEKLLNDVRRPERLFLVSDYTESFAAAARMFFHDEVLLERHSLWNS
jgi:glutamate racemase